ncbi:MAG: hypothetical protein M0R77_07910 [Gammaproteobacteria bacterium]|nr:hypothetical protein [Gammaproteobacteria bacterium]
MVDQDTVINNLLELVRKISYMLDGGMNCGSDYILIMEEDAQEVENILQQLDDLPYESDYCYYSTQDKVALALGRKVDE